MGRGRRNRRPGGGGGGFASGGTGGGGVSQLPALPSTAVAAWHSEITCTAASWTDYIGGRVLAGIGTPVVATDGAFFNGRVVAQAARTGAKTWANRTLPTVVASGTRPWLYGVWRLRATGVIQMMFGFGAATHDYQSVYAETTPRVTGYINDGALGIPGPLADLAVHRHKLWLDGTNGNLTVDNTNFPVATAATIGGAVTAIALGAAAGSDINQCDVSIAFFLVCSAQPTAPEIAALDAWAQAYFGAP
jgi:hypothetical protein